MFLILLITATLAGLGVVLLVDPDAGPAASCGDTLPPQSAEPLVRCFEQIALGGAPRARTSGDTLIYTVDLDPATHSLAEANLLLTRALAETDMEHLLTRAAGDHLLCFVLRSNGGQPLRIDLKH
ncbi:hypothetical protein JW921_10160 [Candidatus Fermentibacterales bacterium]|nr:hypothetical protein [Candidatus Fermentibacterales bacterium]